MASIHPDATQGSVVTFTTHQVLAGLKLSVLGMRDYTLAIETTNYQTSRLLSRSTHFADSKDSR
jgi:hypothetical protein